MSELRAIVYVSSATEALTAPQLERLLTAARKVNLENSVTGVLLYSDGNFMQYLEGTDEAVSLRSAVFKLAKNTGASSKF